MAKKSKIAKNEQRKEIVARYAERRAELKKIIKNPNSTDEERLDAQWEPVSYTHLRAHET